MTNRPTDECWLFRIQDAQGRGPYKPGMSAKWSDAIGGHYKGDYTNLPTFMDEFGYEVIDEMKDIIASEGGAFGCGFRSMEQLNNWFSNTELEKLKKAGISNR